MVYATQIRMKPSYSNLSDIFLTLEDQLQEIDEIYLTGAPKEGWLKKKDVHDWLKLGNKAAVNIAPYPELIPAVSVNGEKYVHSSPNKNEHDNLLNLPKG